MRRAILGEDTISKRMTIEKLAPHCLDVRDLRRRGLFGSEWVTIGPTLKWPKLLRLRIARYAIILDFQGRETSQRVRVSWTKVHLGGERPWMHCTYCEARAARLYKGLAGYLCRACLGNPAYATQGLSAQGRAHYKACKLRLSLGGDARLTMPFPKRPRGMHRGTYARLVRSGMKLEAEVSSELRGREPDYSNLVAYFD